MRYYSNTLSRPLEPLLHLKKQRGMEEQPLANGTAERCERTMVSLVVLLVLLVLLVLVLVVVLVVASICCCNIRHSAPKDHFYLTDRKPKQPLPIDFSYAWIEIIEEVRWYSQLRRETVDICGVPLHALQTVSCTVKCGQSSQNESR